MTLEIWIANSLVGVRIRDLGSLPLDKSLGLHRNDSKIGSKKPNVFPLPVLALTITSLPEQICSKVWICTGNNVANPAVSNADFVDSDKFSLRLMEVY